MQRIKGEENSNQKRKAIFLDRDGVLNVEKSYICKPEDLELYPFTASAVAGINRSGYLAVVVSNQSAIARNMCTEKDILKVHAKLEEDLRAENAHLDAIYYCPHYPPQGDGDIITPFTIECNCRKPRTGMFLQANQELDIDVTTSFMVGDSGRDILAGKNAGCTTVGVRTGHGVKNSTVLPDYMFDDLSAFVGFLIDDPLKGTFEKVSAHYYNSNDCKPFIIVIDGNEQSGKSTLASYLRIAFQKQGITVSKPDMSFITADLIPTYDDSGADIVIAEGCNIFHSAVLMKRAHLRLFTQISWNVYLKRIRTYFSWMGIMDEKEIAATLERNRADFQMIEKESKLADYIIKTGISQ